MREVVDSQVLSVEAHVGEEIELVPVVLQDGLILGASVIGAEGDVSQWPRRMIFPAEDHLRGLRGRSGLRGVVEEILFLLLSLLIQVVKVPWTPGPLHP